MHKLLKQAFTLIELLVVIAIIGILSGLIIVSMSGTTQKAAIAKVQIFNNSLRNTLMLNLVSEWKFDDGSGTVATDSWSGNNTGTLIGASHLPVWKTGSDCVSGSCIQIDGIDDYIDIPNNSNLNLGDGNQGTVGIWVKVSSWPSSGYPSIITKGTIASGWSAGSYHISFWSNCVQYVIYSSTLSYNARNICNLNLPSTNVWHYYVLTWSGIGGLVKGYLDGSPIAAGISQTVKADLRTGENLRIGRSSSDFFAGIVDEARLYNAAIPTSQIQEQYYTGLNKLLANGGITREEYRQRMISIAIN